MFELERYTYFNELQWVDNIFVGWRDYVYKIKVYYTKASNRYKIEIILFDDFPNFKESKLNWFATCPIYNRFFMNLKSKHKLDSNIIYYPCEFSIEELEDFEFVSNKINIISLLK